MDQLVHWGVGNAVAAALLALVVLVLMVGLRIRRPAWVHGLWLLVLLRFVLPGVVPLPVFWKADTRERLPAGAETRDAGSAREVTLEPALDDERWDELTERYELLMEEALANEEVLEADDPVRKAEASAQAEPVIPPVRRTIDWGVIAGWLVGAWCAGSLVWCVVAAVRLVRFGRLLQGAGGRDAGLQARVDVLAEHVGLKVPPELRVVPGSLSPLVWGLGQRTWLVMPRGLLSRLSPEQVDALVVHELAHLKRRDHWVRMLELVATGLFWWHPVLWWSRKRLHEAEEECCDQWVTRTLPGVARGYAIALVETAEFLGSRRVRLPAGASGLGSSHLSRRIIMIMKKREPHMLSRLGTLGLSAMALVVLPWAPSLARPGVQDEPRDRVEQKVEVVLETEDGLDGEEPGDVAVVRKSRQDLERANERLQWSEKMARQGYVAQAQVEEARARVRAIQDGMTAAREQMRAQIEELRGDLENARAEAEEQVELLQVQSEAKRAQLQRAKVELESARKAVERLQRMREKGVVPEDEVDKAELAAKVAEAAIQEKEAELREVEIRMGQIRRRVDRMENLQKRRIELMERRQKEQADRAAQAEKDVLIERERVRDGAAPKMRVEIRKDEAKGGEPGSRVRVLGGPEGDARAKMRIEVKRDLDELREAAREGQAGEELKREVREKVEGALEELESKIDREKLEEGVREKVEGVFDHLEELFADGKIEEELKKGLEQAFKQLNEAFPEGKLREEVMKGLDEAMKELDHELPKIKDEVREGLEEAKREMDRELPKLKIEVRRGMEEAKEQMRREVEKRAADPRDQETRRVMEQLKRKFREREDQPQGEEARARLNEGRARMQAERATRQAEQRIKELEKQIQKLEERLRQQRDKAGKKAAGDDDGDKEGDDDGDKEDADELEAPEPPQPPQPPSAPEAVPLPPVPPVPPVPPQTPAGGV